MDSEDVPNNANWNDIPGQKQAVERRIILPTDQQPSCVVLREEMVCYFQHSDRIAKCRHLKAKCKLKHSKLKFILGFLNSRHIPSKIGQGWCGALNVVSPHGELLKFILRHEFAKIS